MNENCSCFRRSSLPSGLKSGAIIRRGCFRRSSDGKRIARFYCRPCRRGFSYATFSPAFGQKRRNLNAKISLLHASTVSQRRCARILNTRRKTVARKLIYLAKIERSRSVQWVMKALDGKPVTQVIFDEMETSHHSKLKPLSIALAVSPERVILGFEVSIMPAKGLLSAPSIKKYGRRPDHRAWGLDQMMRQIKPHLSDQVSFLSDECPRYPRAVKRHFPQALHQQEKGRRGCVVGQGELKKIGFDPLFSLNHTAAMFRANVNRLLRRTWCTTKSIARLRDHLTLYQAFHNRGILSKKQKIKTRLPSSLGTG